MSFSNFFVDWLRCKHQLLIGVAVNFLHHLFHLTVQHKLNVTTAGHAILGFSQDDIASGKVQYVNVPGSERSEDQFALRITDGTNSVSGFLFAGQNKDIICTIFAISFEKMHRIVCCKGLKHGQDFLRGKF